MAGTGTAHHRFKGWAGLLTIILLPFMLWLGVTAIPNGPAGFVAVLMDTVNAIVALVFFTAALWYCKLEFDEVVMDYFDGGARKFGLFANRIVAFFAWLAAIYAIVKLAFLG